jgi:molybdopterin-binding protein
MARLQATVTKIRRHEILHLLTLQMEGGLLTMITLELPGTICVGSRVLLGVKPMHIGLGKAACEQLSYSNQLPVTVQAVQDGELLSSISLLLADHTKAESIITRDASRLLALRPGDRAVAIIKATDLSIMAIGDACEEGHDA